MRAKESRGEAIGKMRRVRPPVVSPLQTLESSMFFALNRAWLSLGLILLLPVGQALAEGTATDADVQKCGRI
jgi:hypothetical protein